MHSTLLYYSIDALPSNHPLLLGKLWKTDQRLRPLLVATGMSEPQPAGRLGVFPGGTVELWKTFNAIGGDRSRLATHHWDCLVEMVRRRHGDPGPP